MTNFQPKFERLRLQGTATGVDQGFELCIGYPPHQILHRAGELHAHHIVIGHQGKSALQGWELGFVAQRVVMHASILGAVVQSSPRKRADLGFSLPLANSLSRIGKTLKRRVYPNDSIGVRTMEVQMDPLKVLFSMCRSPRYGFHPSEPSLVVRNDHTSGDESTAVGDCHGHNKPDVSQDSKLLHLPEPDEELLFVVGEKMVAAARASGQPITLVVMQVYDLPEVQLVFGRSAAEEVIDEVMTRLTRMAARKGFVVRSKADKFSLLVPGMNAQAAVAELGARFGKPCTIEFELGEDEILLVPDVKVHTLDAGEALKEVYTRVCRLIARERGREQLRCDYLRSEREAHTPMGLPAGSVPEPREKVYYPVLPATIPVPMGAR